MVFHKERWSSRFRLWDHSSQPANASCCNRGSGRYCLAVALASLLCFTHAQQRSSNLQWTEQHLKAGRFNVHKLEVFPAAESLEVTVKAQDIEHFDTINVWLRHAAVPTSERHHLYAVLHRKRGRNSKEPLVVMRVNNPLQGDWYIAVAPGSASEKIPSMEVNDHEFIPDPGRSVYSVKTKTKGCERGRFGYPKCQSDWMKLSWGKEAIFHGALGAGKDAWTCSMYQVAPYTSQLTFALLSPNEQHMTHATPQIYARYQGYPTLNEFDTTTAVNGNEWKNKASIDLPKSGTWYMCVHVKRLMSSQSTAVAVQVNAQILPHNECVKQNDVSANGRRMISCQNEVEKLEVRYTGNAKGTNIPLPHFVLVHGDAHQSIKGEKNPILHITGGSIRYFSFTVDPSLVGYSLRIRIRSTADKAMVLAYLRQNALPQTSVFDMHPNVIMREGVLDWHVRFPSAGEWFLGVFSSTSLSFTLNVDVEACPYSCSDRGSCQLENQGGGLVVGSCACAFGYSGTWCEKSAEDVSGLSYYGSILLALLSPPVALLPAAYALYLDRHTEALLFVVASATALACLFSEIFAENDAGAAGAAVADQALTVVLPLVALISVVGLKAHYSAPLQMAVVLGALLCCAWRPPLLAAPPASALVAFAAGPLLFAAQSTALGAARGGGGHGGGSRDAVEAARGAPRVDLPVFGLGLALACAAAAVESYQDNTNYVSIHALWRILMYLSSLALLASNTGGGGGVRGDGQRGQENDESLLANSKLF